MRAIAAAFLASLLAVPATSHADTVVMLPLSELEPLSDAEVHARLEAACENVPGICNVSVMDFDALPPSDRYGGTAWMLRELCQSDLPDGPRPAQGDLDLAGGVLEAYERAHLADRGTASAARNARACTAIGDLLAHEHYTTALQPWRDGLVLVGTWALVPPDPARAREYLSRGCELGDDRACLILRELVAE